MTFRADVRASGNYPTTARPRAAQKIDVKRAISAGWGSEPTAQLCSGQEIRRA